MGLRHPVWRTRHSKRTYIYTYMCLYICIYIYLYIYAYVYIYSGKLVGMTVEVTIADQTFKKNVAFKYGSKPYQSLVCAGLEEGIESMRVGECVCV